MGHQTRSKVLASCKISWPDNIRGVLSKNNKITPQKWRKLWTQILLFLLRAPWMLFGREILQETKTFDLVWCPKISDLFQFFSYFFQVYCSCGCRCTCMNRTLEKYIKQKKSKILGHQTRSIVLASCGISCPNNIRGVPSKKTKKSLLKSEENFEHRFCYFC